MITLRRRTIETALALTLVAMPLILLLWIFPTQVPESLADDISARVYPDALMYVWVLLAAASLIAARMQDKREIMVISRVNIIRPAVIFVIVLVGFFMLSQVGYVVGAAFYILTFSWLLKERGPAAWLAAGIVPLLVYLLMLYAFEVRLPTSLNLLFE